VSPVELFPGLWRWTAPHSAWRPGAAKDSPGDWGRDVGCVLWVEGDAATFIDPLVPAPEARFWEWADTLVARARHVHVLTTLKFHRRSREQVAARYRASTSRARSALPEGVVAVPLRGAGEVCFWLPGAAALVCGDRVQGADAGGLRLCPQSWLGYLGNGLTRSGLADVVASMLELPIERVIVSHGEPMLAGGREALAAAVEAAR
jgi:hypothetical protein